LDDQSLKAALHTAGLSNTDKLLIVLLFGGDNPQAVKDVRVKAVAQGVRAAKDWNISRLLGASKGRAILVSGGWELTASGRQHLAALGITGDRVVEQQATTLRKLLPKIASEKNRDFVAEAVSCYERKNLRAAAVLSWVGAVSILYDHVMRHALVKFSNEWVRRNPQKNKPITTVDDLSDLKEDTFLDILHAISVIGKSVKDELKGCLKFRNGCGHPNTLVVGETRVAAHLETLINNVYQKF
jgi:hypothetical protein